MWLHQSNVVYHIERMFASIFLFILLAIKTESYSYKLRNINWTLQNSNGSIVIPARVPGGVYSDLHHAGIIDDILYRYNDVSTRWVAHDNWTYVGRFYSLKNKGNDYKKTLVLHGVDTVASVKLNGLLLGRTNNMFVRYVFNLFQNTLYEHSYVNELRIEIMSPIAAAKIRSDMYFTAPDCVPKEYNGECHANQLRKMQASFGWDWGPAFPSVGLWKEVYVEYYKSAKIRSITTQSVKIDQYWHLKITAYLELGYILQSGRIDAELKVDANQSITVSKEFSKGVYEVAFNMSISENVVSLWWPNGYGEQPLYDLRLSVFSEGEDTEANNKTVQIGFRTLELVEEDASKILGNTTGGTGLTFYFKVNGYPIFMKGSNWIPAHILPEFGDNKKVVDDLLKAAKVAHMSMLRVWGGGVFESDYFYERCDQLGILIWQDLLFACSMYPVDPDFLGTVSTEVEQNVKRLQHHSSIALWAGNNENEVALRGNWYDTNPQFNKYKQDYITLYVDTIKPIVESIDPGRRYLVSSPSNGRESEQEGYVALNPYDSHYGDTHYYNYLSDNWNMNIYPKTRFASEYGFQSLPSIATMRKATKEIEDFNIDSEYSKHRQHSPNGYAFIESQMARHFELDKNEDYYFYEFVYYSQISQAMSMKAETEFYRQSQADWYTMGALYWQLNDVWQAPSWSGIEYGGTWKMLHYHAKNFFAPVLVSPRLHTSDDVDVYLINDRLVPIVDAQIKVEVFNWSSIRPIKSTVYPASAEALSTKKQDIMLSIRGAHEDTFLKFSLIADGVRSSPNNYVFPAPFKNVRGLKIPNIEIKVTVVTRDEMDESFLYWVDLKIDTVVLFLWLESSIPGKFEDNGFILAQPYLRVQYKSSMNVSTDTLHKSIFYKYYINN